MIDACIDEISYGGQTTYDTIVERWNKMEKPKRLARAAVCKEEGHDWARLSWGPLVCKRCLRYDRNE